MGTIAIVGAGFSGSVVARELAEAGYQLQVFESRSHVAGNCHTERDEETGVMVHKYGPHILHTDSDEVWRYLSRFAELMPFSHRVKTTSKEKVYSLPINLQTINQFFGECLSPAEAVAFIESKADNSITEPRNFEEQALKFVGPELYEAFFKGYTVKQWGRPPAELPASILKRLPLRFNYNDSYFGHKYQGIPRDGYTQLVENILEHPKIDLNLDTTFSRSRTKEFDHVFYTGPIDLYFEYDLGPLGYRTLDFREIRSSGDFQGCAVMNYADEVVPYTRITEHKHFSPWENHSATVCFEETSRECKENDIPYYPIRLAGEQRLLKNYISLAQGEKRTSFLGRLGTYRYLDMDVTVAEALNASSNFIALKKSGQRVPAFFTKPI